MSKRNLNGNDLVGFSINYDTEIETSYFKVPWEKSFRRSTVSLQDTNSLPAFRSLGEHVFKNQSKYMPAYSILNEETLKEMQKLDVPIIIIENEMNNTTIYLLSAYSSIEAANSWFTRTKQLANSILERNPRNLHQFKVVSERKELLSYYDENNTEIDEATFLKFNGSQVKVSWSYAWHLHDFFIAMK